MDEGFVCPLWGELPNACLSLEFPSPPRCPPVENYPLIEGTVFLSLIYILISDDYSRSRRWTHAT